MGYKYRPDIDGLRAVAVLPVVLYHLGLGFPGGYVGVDIFYVISGYLITGILKREIEQGTFSFAGFYERRVRRLFPALFVMFATVLIAGWFLLLPSDFLITFRGGIATILFSSNVYFWLTSGYWNPDSTLNPLLHTWSLAVEEQFYLGFPVFLLLCMRFMPRQLWLLTWLIAVASLVAAIALLSRMPSAVFYLSPFRAWELLAGCLLALNVIRPIASGLLRELGAAFGLALIGYAVFAYSDRTPFPGAAALAPVLGAAALIHCGASGDSVASRLLRLPPLVYVGAISYSLYLWHWPIIVFARFWHGLDLSPLSMWLLLGASLLAASISYHVIEQPFRKRRLGRTRHSLFAGAAATMCALIVACASGVFVHGMPNRFEPSVVKLDRERNPADSFAQCDGRPNNRSSTFCVIGDIGVPPTLLIWGDSHVLAWAPAFDSILKTHHMSATFAPMSGCPPLFAVYVKAYISNYLDVPCHETAVALKRFLDAQRSLKGVIMTAKWDRFFSFDSAVVLTDEDGSTGTTRIASSALVHTLHYFKDRGLVPLLLGDVPGATDNVPLAMALSRLARMTMKPLPLSAHRIDNSLFYAAARNDTNVGLASFVDTASWFCDGGVCRFQEAGMPLYRDKGHLSVIGATSRIPQLEAALENVGMVERNLPAAVYSSTKNESQ